MGGEMELGKNRKEVTERVSTNWKDNGQKEKKKKKRKSCRGNINRGEVGNGRKTKIKGSRRRVQEKERLYRQRVVENNNSI
jgi:hypothetical protein